MYDIESKEKHRVSPILSNGLLVVALFIVMGLLDTILLGNSLRDLVDFQKYYQEYTSCQSNLEQVKQAAIGKQMMQGFRGTLDCLEQVSSYPSIQQELEYQNLKSIEQEVTGQSPATQLQYQQKVVLNVEMIGEKFYKKSIQSWFFTTVILTALLVCIIKVFKYAFL